MKTGCRDERLVRRRLLLAAAVLPAWPAHAWTPARRLDLVSILDFQEMAGTDWTAAFNMACTVARRVHIPAGEYVLRSAGVPSDTEIFGDGDSSILRMPSDARYLITVDSGSADIERNVRAMSMRGLQLRASCDTDGMSEFRHLLSLNGVSRVRLERILFRGFRGDAVYLGSGNDGNSERHNAGIDIVDCRFDGINRENRNGISVIDCDGLLVDRCRFENLTRRNMPGAIDVEPNRNPYHVVRNIHLRRNRFNRVGGNAAVISVYVPAEAPAPRNIVVEDNVSDDYLGSGSFFHYNDNRPPAREATDAAIVVRRNEASAGAASVALASGKGIVLAENRFRDFRLSARVGFDSPTLGVRNVTLKNNLFERCGTSAPSAVTVHRADGVLFASNRFIDGGDPRMRASSAVLFARGRSSGVVFEGNRFETNGKRDAVAIQTDPAHALAPATNRFAGNMLNGLVSFFQTDP